MHSGKTLMMLRKFKNKSQDYVADQLKKSQQYVSQIEKQEDINGKLLDKLLKALNSSRNEWEKIKKMLRPAPTNET